MEVGEGSGDIDREDGVVFVVVEKRLSEFVKFFGACGSSFGVLVWFECRGYCRCDVSGDSAGDDPAQDGAASDGADVAVRFDKWYDPC